MSIPAICHNAHYLFEGGVLEFDSPVEIHVTRFSDNISKITTEDAPKIPGLDKIVASNYPKYDIPFTDFTSFRVFINCNEPITSPHRETVEVVISNYEQYDLILTTDDLILNNCSNAVLFPYGTTWLNKGRIDDQNAIGHYAHIVDELHKDKKFETSFLCSFHARELDGYQMRKEIWLMGLRNKEATKLLDVIENTSWKDKELIKTPINFYSSPRMIIPNAPDWYMEQFLPFTDNPLPNDNKDILFSSQFHIAIESTQVKNYFTEKLIDALITKTVPIYWGCPNIGEFFNEKGIIQANSTQDMVDKINELTPETYESMLPYIEENFEIAKKYASSFAGRVKEEILKHMKPKEEYKTVEIKEGVEIFPIKGHPINTDKILTIGIPSLNERKESLNELLSFMNSITNKEDISKIEVIVNIDDGEKTVGQKRNEILEQANGKFVCFVDDDDKVDEEYINLIIKTIEENPDLDCIGFTGMYYVNGEPTMLFKHAKEYGGHYKKEGIQYRPVNHLNPVRTELAQQIGFPEKNFGEDSDYCDRLLESGLVKNEVILDKVMYHYLWNSELTRTH